MEEYVLELIKAWGFSAEKIEENNKEKRPDFLVQDDLSAYVIELKEREDNPELIDEINRKTDAGDLHVRISPLTPSDTVAGIVGRAKKQLNSTGEIVADYKLIWLAAVGRDQEEKYENFFSTLYGSTNIINIDSNERLKTCYFFRNSAFYRYQSTLDAAILSHNQEAQLCVNPFSERYPTFTKSGLCKFFRSEGALIDPTSEEKNGEAYIADTDAARNNEQYIIDYLCDKYQQKLIHMDLGYHSFTTAFPDEKT